MATQKLSQFWIFLRRRFSKPSQTDSAPKFVDLAPTANADEAGIYFAALDYATNNDEVLNIALTGPYGSGKSSVVKSFLTKYPRQALQISLASFVPDGEVSGARVSKQEIERSILQQILYGVEADKLPFSRFKRIQTPKRWPIGVSFLIAIGLASSWYLFSKQTDVLSGAFLEPLELSNWFNFLCIGVFGAFVWRVVHSVYTTSFGLSLKSISLKDVQIAPDAANEESILNRHLDEILYFFQSTDYDLVVIEDLDRFEDPDIFVTLREINGLINANEGVRRRVRFLYALRDDIFANTDRTKFFEFIVPVIPVINHSNSIDKVLEQGRRIDLEARLNRQFVRDVSRYLTDMRLIRNIFNEYLVYSANLKADSDSLLDANKLLAILIYKNVIPRDFAALHRQEGALSQVLSRYDEHVSRMERQLRDEISTIEADLATGETQLLRDEVELRKVYAMAIVERVPANYHTIEMPNSNISLANLAKGNALETVLSQTSMSVSGTYVQTTIDLRDLEESIDPVRSFSQRKAEVSRKSAKFKQSSERRLRELKSQLASLRTRKFHEVVRESADLIDEVFAEAGDNRDLLRFLILEGHLDDTYYQYISLFHSGRLSPNDNKFLIQIRAYANPDPDFPIDNSSEVVASMRNEDFRHHYVLNRFIVDHLLGNVDKYSRQVAAATDFMAAHFGDCGEFFRSYYARGAQVERLIELLATRWSAFPAVALDGADGASHAARILAYVPNRLLKNAPYAGGALAEFLSVNIRQTLIEGVEFDLDRLRTLRVQVGEVASLADLPNVLSFVAYNGLYRISIDNLRHILGQVVGWQQMGDLETRHYSTLKEANDKALLKRVTEDFPTYVSDVLLKLAGNTAEDISTIADVLAHEDVEPDLLEEFLRRQTAVFPAFEDVPAAFHPVLLERAKIEPTWENCLGFMLSEAYDPELLTQYLQGSETQAALSSRQIPDGEAAFPLRQFLLENDVLDQDAYKSYIRKLPNASPVFPKVDAAKIRVLIEERRVTFEPPNFENLEDVELQVLFIASNFAAYDTDKAQFSIDDDFRAKLLRTGITDAQKLRLISDMDESYVADNVSVAADIGAILDRSPMERRDYGSDFVRAIVLNSRITDVQISLFNKLHSTLSESEVRDVLAGLPEPFRDIARFGKSPRIEKSNLNRQLVVWLKERNIISSFSNPALGDDIRIFTFKKQS